MSEVESQNWVVLGDWTRDLLEPYGAQIEAHALLLRLEFDPHFVVVRSPERATALEGLLRMIFATTPDGCQIYMACQRSGAPVSRLGEGQWVARWQVLLDHDAGAFHSKIRERLEASFVDAGWPLEIVSISDDREYRARVRCREPAATR